MCREGAWAELTVEVTSVGAFRRAARIKKRNNTRVRIRSDPGFFVKFYLNLLYPVRQPLLMLPSDASFFPVAHGKNPIASWNTLPEVHLL